MDKERHIIVFKALTSFLTIICSNFILKIEDKIQSLFFWMEFTMTALKITLRGKHKWLDETMISRLLTFKPRIHLRDTKKISKLTGTLQAAVWAPFPCQILRNENCFGNTPAGITSDKLAFETSRQELMTSATHTECCIFPANNII